MSPEKSSNVSTVPLNVSTEQSETNSTPSDTSTQSSSVSTVPLNVSTKRSETTSTPSGTSAQSVSSDAFNTNLDDSKTSAATGDLQSTDSISVSSSTVQPTSLSSSQITGSVILATFSQVLSTTVTTGSVIETTTDNQIEVVDVCKSSVLEVEKELYVISPGILNNTNHPLDLHCVIDLSCKETQVKCHSFHFLSFIDAVTEYHCHAILNPA